MALGRVPDSEYKKFRLSISNSIQKASYEFQHTRFVMENPWQKIQDRKVIKSIALNARRLVNDICDLGPDATIYLYLMLTADLEPQEAEKKKDEIEDTITRLVKYMPEIKDSFCHPPKRRAGRPTGTSPRTYPLRLLMSDIRRDVVYAGGKKLNCHRATGGKLAKVLDLLRDQLSANVLPAGLIPRQLHFATLNEWTRDEQTTKTKLKSGR